MTRKARGVPKEIASFGERQFQETGASTVDVLRVKAATIRKHFSKLRGITYLVGVVNVDYVRVYFFDSIGVMLVGENVEHAQYEKIKKSSRLLAKYEKVKPPTEEELRIEATEELRQDLAREIRKVVRVLGRKEPEFPTTYVTRGRIESIGQGFGLELNGDGVLVFEQALLEAAGGLGVVTRAAFLQLLSESHRSLELSQAVGNGIGYALMSRDSREKWWEVWSKSSEGSAMEPIVWHLKKHIDTYSWRGFSRILDLIQALPHSAESETQLQAIGHLHEAIEVPLGTQEHIAVKGLCGTLGNLRKLAARRHLLESIHLAPRVICDPTPLGVHLSLKQSETMDNRPDSWLDVEYMKGSEAVLHRLIESEDQVLESISYRLSIEDLKPGGIVAEGKSVLEWILYSLGFKQKEEVTFESHIEFSDVEIDAGERAVLERLIQGGLSVLSDTLIGSPQRLNSLVKKGRVILLPDFNHAGLRPNLVLMGRKARIETVASHSVEATLLHTKRRSFAVVSAPSFWMNRVITASAKNDVEVWPILSTYSSKGIVRSEQAFSSESEHPTWSNGKSS
ncbi:MAG: hypothetical protein ACFFD9_03975 [Candidatus Thorarchaeota archaeon]